jgi:hypothetical protein
LPDGERAYLSLVVELGRNCASSSVNAKDRKYEGYINVSQWGTLVVPLCHGPGRCDVLAVRPFRQRDDIA